MNFRVTALLVLAAVIPAVAQSGFDDDRVLLQGFYWESYRHGHPDRFPTFGTQKWYEVVKRAAPVIRDARFDLIWLPPPSYAGEESAGYNPKEYFRLDNSYGSFVQHQAMLRTLLKAGIEPVADIVINHRDGTNGWGDFQNPAWGTWAICRTDEAFSNPSSGLAATPDDQKGDCEERPAYVSHTGSTYAYDSFRDIAHGDVRVRRDIVRYLRQLQSLGYRGWRYDMVHGYLAKWIGQYNRLTQPTFSVGEYDWDKQADQRGWVWNTATNDKATGVEHLRTASDVFDFSTQFALKEIRGGTYDVLFNQGQGIGLMGDTTDGMPWKNRAVTFLENHDTGYRTNADGTPQEHHESDSFANNWQVEQGYAYILTHPGIPSVYWKHYFDWGQDLQKKIKALVNARKVAGVHSGSALHVQANARSNGVYAARIQGTHGDLYVRVGGSDSQWQPSLSSYSNYREYAQGAGWKVWVGLPGNSAFREAGRRGSFPVPKYRKPEIINVGDVE